MLIVNFCLTYVQLIFTFKIINLLHFLYFRVISRLIFFFVRCFIFLPLLYNTLLSPLIRQSLGTFFLLSLIHNLDSQETSCQWSRRRANTHQNTNILFGSVGKTKITTSSQRWTKQEALKRWKDSGKCTGICLFWGKGH